MTPEAFNINAALNTAAITLLGGISLFVLERVLERVFINPIQKQKEIIEEIAVSLIRYATFYNQPVSVNYSEDSVFRQRRVDAKDKTRELAAQLKVRTNGVLFYKIWSKIGYVIPQNKIEEAYRELIGLSNSYFENRDGSRNSERAEKIRNFLKIPKDS